MPVNRLQQALMRAAAPRVTRDRDRERAVGEQRVHLSAPGLRAGRLPRVRAAGESGAGGQPAGRRPWCWRRWPAQLGCEAEVDFGDGAMRPAWSSSEGQLGQWRPRHERARRRCAAGRLLLTLKLGEVPEHVPGLRARARLTARHRPSTSTAA